MINKLDSSYINITKNTNLEEPKSDDEKVLMEKSKEFESLFVKMMLDSMDKTVKREDGLFHGGQAEEMFRDMLNRERSIEMSNKQSFGLAKQIYNQLSRKE